MDVLIPVESVFLQVLMKLLNMLQKGIFFLRGMLIFRCNQVFHILHIRLSARALDEVFE